jgi:hypothetical protein
MKPTNERTLSINCSAGETVTKQQLTCFVHQLIADAMRPQPLRTWKRDPNAKIGDNAYYTNGFSEGTLITLRGCTDTSCVEFTYTRQGKQIYTAVETNGNVECDMHLAALLHKVTRAVTLAEATNKPDLLAQPKEAIGKKHQAPQDYDDNMQSPVDHYIQRLVAAGVSLPWKPIPDGEPGTPGFRLEDTEHGFVTTLTMEAQCEEYSQLKLEVFTNGKLEMYSVEWIAAGGTDHLHELYATLQAATSVHEKPESGRYDPEEELLTERFVAALIRDTRSKCPELRYVQRDDTYVSDDFGIAECRVYITKEWERGGSDQYSIRVVTPDGNVVLSLTETASVTDDEAELRGLYQLVSDHNPPIEIPMEKKDMLRFIERKNFEAHLRSILEHTDFDGEDTAVPDDKCILVSDVFREVPVRRTVQQFIDEVALQKGSLDEHSRKKLRSLAESAITMICAFERKPNRLRFPVAAKTDTTTGHQADMSIIANAATSWHIGLCSESQANNFCNMMSRAAILILATLFVDQIP